MADDDDTDAKSCCGPCCLATCAFYADSKETLKVVFTTLLVGATVFAGVLRWAVGIILLGFLSLVVVAAWIYRAFSKLTRENSCDDCIPVLLAGALWLAGAIWWIVVIASMDPAEIL